MQLVKISDFQHRKAENEPQITFSTKGIIRVNRRGILTLATEKVINDQMYLHFAYEGEKDNHRLYAWVDNNPTEGLKLRRKVGFKAEEVDQHVCNAALLVNHFKILFDWPLSADKKPTIRYNVQPEIIKTEFSDRTFRLI